MTSYSITCSSCGTANRIPADKEGKAGRCGTCRTLLLPLYHQPQTLGEHSFDTFLAHYHGPILAEFWAPW